MPDAEYDFCFSHLCIFAEESPLKNTQSCLYSSELLYNGRSFSVPGKEFEHLIDSHGPEHVTCLMQKVISALEHLERFAAASDAEEATIENLRATITHLELEEVKKNEEKHRHSKVRIQNSPPPPLPPWLADYFNGNQLSQKMSFVS